MSGKRIEWVDIVKYVCIVFVMVHHLEGKSEALYIFYASFFLKSFFFTAGYVYRHTSDFKGFFIKKVKGLFVPWLIFSTLNIILSQILSFNEHNDLLTEIGWNLLQIRNHGDGIWFVAALFVAFIPFYFLIEWSEREGKNKSVLVIAISFFLSVGSIAYTKLMDPSILPWNGTELPWHLEYIFQAMLFMVMGYYFRKEYEVKFDKYNTKMNRICLGGVYLLLIYLPYVLGIEFPTIINVLYQYVRELAGVFLVVSVCKVLKTNRYISYVGQNTLIYFALHGKLLSVIQTVLIKIVPEFYASILGNTISANIFVIMLALVMSVLLIVPAWIINNFFPFVLGRKKTSENGVKKSFEKGENKLEKSMRSFKVIILLMGTLWLSGCSKAPVEQGWIPEKDVSPSAKGEIKEESENEEEKEQKTREDETFNLTDIVKVDETPFCSLKELKQTIRDIENEETSIHMNTYFIDNNGLLCIGIDAVFDFQENQCTLKKKYYLPDKSVFTEQESFDIDGKWKEENKIFYVDISFLSELFSWDYDISQKNQVVIRDQNITFEENTSVVYEPMTFDVVAGNYWTTTGNIEEDNFGNDNSDIFYCCTKPEAYVEVADGEQLRFNFYCSWLPEVASILFLDSNDKVIQFYSYMASTTLTDQIVKVPTGATKMHLSFFKGQQYKVDKVSYVTGVDLNQIDTEWYEEQCEKKLKENQELSWENTTMKPLDKAYITFVLDDCRSDMDQVADIFETYGIPLCISAINGELYHSASQGKESRLEVCRRVEKNGGEILCHNAEVITKEKLQDFSTKYQHFYKDKKYLEAFGFDVQGIILAGGEGQVTGNMESDAWIRTFFDYSDLYGMEEKGEPYYHGRAWLGNYWDRYQETIQEIVQEKRWVSFYFHGLGEVNQQTLEGILQYVSQISEEELEVTNYRTIYERYYK